MIADGGQANEAGPKARAFISYSRKDIIFADRLGNALTARGIEALIDRSEIYAFEDWWKRIEALIGRADAIVFVLSPDAIASEVALREVAHAAALNKRFAPIVCRRVDDSATPEALRRLNFIFFDDPAHFEASADALAEALETDISWIRRHTEFGEAARRWASSNGASGLLLRSPALEQSERWIAARPRGAPAPTEETKAFVARSRQAATRRRNVLTASLAVGLALALILAGVAYWQRGEAIAQRGIAERNEAQANEQRDKATRNFKLAQNTADSLVFDVVRGLRNVRGIGAETVRKILDTAKTTFEQLAASAPDDLDLQLSRTAMLDEFGHTYQTMGDLDAALKSYETALSIREHLIDYRRTTERQINLTISYDLIGDVLMAQGNLEKALNFYRGALVVREQLATDDPGNTERQRDLAISYQKVGNVLSRQGKLDEALKVYRDCVAIAEREAAANPLSTEWQRGLAISYGNVGDVLKAQGKVEETLTAYNAAIAIEKRLVAADPNNTQWQFSLALSYWKLGGVLLAQGKLEEALTIYRDGLAIVERLAATDRSNTEWQQVLSATLGRIGDVLVTQGKLEEALKAYRERLAISERLVAIDHGNADWQHDLSIALGGIGDVLARQGKLDEAFKAYSDALAIQQRLADADRSNTEIKGHLATSYERVGRTLRTQNKLKEALEAFRSSIAILMHLVEADHTNSEWQRDLQLSIGRLAGLSYRFVLARDFSNALASADQVIALAPDQIWFNSNRAHALMFLGRVDEAQAIYLRYRGEKKAHGEKPWETIILDDFLEFRKVGLTHPLMDEIEKRFAAGG